MLPGLGDVARVIPGATKGGATPGKRTRSAPKPKAEGLPWDVTGSLSDLFGVVTTIGGTLNPSASLTYNSIAFSAMFGEPERTEKKAGPGEGTILEKTMSTASTKPADGVKGVRGARQTAVRFLEIEASKRDFAAFDVVIWVDGKDILAGYTQLSAATGFELTPGTTAGISFSGTAFSKAVPSMFLLTFTGFVDLSGFGNMEFTGSTGIRADGTVTAFECQPVERRLLQSSHLNILDPLIEGLYSTPDVFSDGTMWRIGWKEKQK
jgi:hypothetical protein